MAFEPCQHGGQKLKVVLPQHVPRGINRDSSHVDHIHLSLRFLHPHELLQRKRPKKKEKADDHRPLHFLPASLDRPCPPRWIYRVRGEASGKACRVKQAYQDYLGMVQYPVPDGIHSAYRPNEAAPRPSEGRRGASSSSE
ncbi:hypothetical protein GW17_00034504 [Ensete ventricosum]|nr:hypothetical protein GW17_00034504 [Ensete ventricosum]